MARAERKVAHLALDAARVASFAAGDDPLLEDFLEYAVMKGHFVLRGERRDRWGGCGEGRAPHAGKRGGPGLRPL